MAIILITFTEQEVCDLQTKCWGGFDNINFFGKPAQDFNVEWHWTIKGKILSGTSGWNSLKHVINQNPGAMIFNYKDFIKHNELPECNKLKKYRTQLI